MPDAVIPDDILTPRLILRRMCEEFLEASLREERSEADRLLGFATPQAWFAEKGLMTLRRDGCRADPAYRPWSLRAIGLTASGEMIGHIGFHTRPDPPYLKDLAPGAVEMGYSIIASRRRQGYAIEAIRAMMDWAARNYGVERFVISVAPANLASTALAARLGFLRIGGHEDEEDGYEDIYLLTRRGAEAAGR